jgi:hypothetical protein
MNGVDLIAENEFSKTFKYNDIDVFIAKAVDDEKSKHYLVISIPTIPETQSHEIQYPMEYDTMELRDEDFKKFDVEYCKEFTDNLIVFMKEQKKLQEEKLMEDQKAEEIK